MKNSNLKTFYAEKELSKYFIELVKDACTKITVQNYVYTKKPKVCKNPQKGIVKNREHACNRIHVAFCGLQGHYKEYFVTVWKTLQHMLFTNKTYWEVIKNIVNTSRGMNQKLERRGYHSLFIFCPFLLFELFFLFVCYFYYKNEFFKYLLIILLPQEINILI